MIKTFIFVVGGGLLGMAIGHNVKTDFFGAGADTGTIFTVIGGVGGFLLAILGGRR